MDPQSCTHLDFRLKRGEIGLKMMNLTKDTKNSDAAATNDDSGSETTTNQPRIDRPTPQISSPLQTRHKTTKQRKEEAAAQLLFKTQGFTP
ncbi:unnamed protein product [Microthlaspi erraticum]|uniref:Uncharacterized protein n=1 Tax=Microthlaspi erraticum TaxID=1685480 RepID=A0A6D2K107_9BRAS|nr:unnamed protein product [Microthlaspi erraticum]